MINFTGSTKKRVVNLGNQRAMGRSFLDQTKAQRQQREESRIRERSIRLIQTYIRRYLELLRCAETIKQQWISESLDWDLWAAQFAFIARYGKRTGSGELLPHLQKGIELSEGRLSERATALLVSSLKLILSKLEDSEVTPIIRCLHNLIQTYGVKPESSQYAGIIPGLRRALRFLPVLVVEIVLAVNVNDSYSNFVTFLASIPPETLPVVPEFTEILRNTLASKDLQLVVLTDAQKVNLLENVLTLHTGAKFTPQDYVMHGEILSTIKFSLRVASEDEDDDLVQESQYENQETRLRSVRVSQQTADVILVLYSSNYISHAIGQFQSNSRSSYLALQSIVLLMYLFPHSKTKLCMLLTITPGSHRWFYGELTNHNIYRIFKVYEEECDLLSALQLRELFSYLPGQEVAIFWNLLCTYEELLSYWLIVSNDVESFQDGRISLEEVNDFSHFLKILCLTLIFNANDEKSRAFFVDLQKLQDISLALLNQLYIKNLRLKYLPEQFWKLKHLKFDINSMILCVLEDEERRIEQGEASSDEESGVRRAKRHRTDDVAARLEVLNRASFFVDFKDRVKIFQSLIEADQSRLDMAVSFFLDTPPKKLSADIHRDALLVDAFDSFHKTGHSFKHRISVTFHNEHGVEAGIDGGGITKEFLTSVVAEGFNPEGDLRLFKETTTDNEVYPNDDIFLKISKRIDLPDQQQRLLYMRFLGMCIGKCLYENVLVDIAFAPFFLSKWGDSQYPTKNSVNDLRYLDLELYSNLMKLLDMNDAQLNSLDLNFTIDEVVGGNTLKYDLLPPEGEATMVNTLNRLNYIHQMANFKLNQSLHIQTKYFLEGLFDIINATWLNMFDPFELQMLISGGQSDINILDWKENVLYGGYLDHDITIVYFWQVVEEMSPQERCKLIKFVTSVSRAPLLGFGALAPNFGIRNSGRYTDRLPTASTCVNLLKLPDYQDKQIMREKLLYAINTNSGFDLS